MTLGLFLFYMCGIFTFGECILSGLRQFDDKYNLHIVDELFGFSLYILTLLWSIGGIFLGGDYLVQFSIILCLELAYPIYKLLSDYEETVSIHLLRKLTVILICLWIMTDAFYTYNN